MIIIIIGSWDVFAFHVDILVSDDARNLVQSRINLTLPVLKDFLVLVVIVGSLDVCVDRLTLFLIFIPIITRNLF